MASECHFWAMLPVSQDMLPCLSSCLVTPVVTVVSDSPAAHGGALPGRCVADWVSPLHCPPSAWPACALLPPALHSVPHCSKVPQFPKTCPSSFVLPTPPPGWPQASLAPRSSSGLLSSPAWQGEAAPGSAEVLGCCRQAPPWSCSRREFPFSQASDLTWGRGAPVHPQLTCWWRLSCSALCESLWFPGMLSGSGTYAALPPAHPPRHPTCWTPLKSYCENYKLCFAYLTPK